MQEEALKKGITGIEKKEGYNYQKSLNFMLADMRAPLI